MKILIYSLVIAFNVLLSTAQHTPGEEAIIEYVADDFNVSESDVTLLSPNIVDVDLGMGTSQAVASFYDCGTECTRVVIVFDDRTLELSVIEEMGGI